MPRSKLPENFEEGCKRRLNFIFRYQPFEATSDGKLCGYLNGEKTEFATNEMIIWAARAFWMPFALRAEGRAEADLKRAAKRAIRRLKEHISYLEESFDLDPSYVEKAGIGRCDSSENEGVKRLNDNDEEMTLNQASQAEDLRVHNDEDDQYIGGMFSKGKI